MEQPLWIHDTVQTNGVRLHYVTLGEGPLMLTLHGFPEFWYSWRHQIPEFAQDYKVVALDLRGYNESDKPDGVDAYAMSNLVEDVNGVITALGYERCVLVGHDWGGAIAWNMAYTHGDRIEKLIVMNLPHPAKFAQGLLTPQQLVRSWYIFFFQIPGLPEAILQWNNYQAIENAFRGMAIDKTAFTPRDIEAYKTAAAKPGALTAMVNYYRNILNPWLTRSDWGELHIPTLMIWGEDDAALGIELTHNTEQYVKDLTIQYIPNCSHWVQQECPRQVNQSMRDFLAESPEF